MPVPATSGQLRTDLNSMEIGDYISCKYTAGSGAAGVFSDLGADAATVAAAGEIAVGGDSSPHQFFYLIKTDKGMLISDRVVQHSISWDVLNTAKMIQGMPFLLDIVPQMTANITDKGEAICSNYFSSGPVYPPYKAFDKDISSMSVWATSDTTGYLGFSFPNPIKAKCYSFICNNSGTGFPKNWTFEGWDGANWIVLDTKTNVSVSLGIWYTFSIQNNTAYSKYRMNITANNGKVWLGINELQIGENEINIRSLTGGVAYMGADNLPKLTDQGLGAWPSINEWDTYIVNSNLNGKIIAGDDNVWHWNHGVLTICKETPIIRMMAATGAATAATAASRINRSYTTTFDLKTPYHNASSGAWGSVGFRPVFEYIEPNSKATNLWY